MKIMKRVLCISIAILILFTSLSACVPRQQEEPSELDLLKAEWQRYVVDRTEEIYGVTVVAELHLDEAIPLIQEKSAINEILDICQTLDVSNLTLSEDLSDTPIKRDLSVALCISASPDVSNFYIYMCENGEAYLCLEAEDMHCWAHISNWPVYEQLYEHRYIYH